MKIFNTPPETWEQIRLRHETVYRYTTKVKFSPHRLVLRPREGHDLRLNSMNLITTPGSKMRWYRDMLDNTIAIAEILEPASELRVVNEFVVSVPPAVDDQHEPILVPHPSLIAGIEQMVAVPYLQFIYPPEVERLRDWFVKSGLAPKKTRVNTPIFDDMARLIQRTIEYNRREVKGVQSPVATLRLESGSCRDMAVLMMETSRALGYPARFVSGYMESSNSAVGRGSTHAWAEIYLPEHGWTGYDPSVGRRVGPGHIPIGVSHHPRGVMPVSGGYIGPKGVGSALEVAISTERLPPLKTAISHELEKEVGR